MHSKQPATIGDLVTPSGATGIVGPNWNPVTDVRTELGLFYSCVIECGASTGHPHTDRHSLVQRRRVRYSDSWVWRDLSGRILKENMQCDKSYLHVFQPFLNEQLDIVPSTCDENAGGGNGWDVWTMWAYKISYFALNIDVLEVHSICSKWCHGKN